MEECVYSCQWLCPTSISFIVRLKFKESFLLLRHKQFCSEEVGYVLSVCVGPTGQMASWLPYANLLCIINWPEDSVSVSVVIMHMWSYATWQVKCNMGVVTLCWRDFLLLLWRCRTARWHLIPVTTIQEEWWYWEFSYL